jgi:hypothetical protein
LEQGVEQIAEQFYRLVKDLDLQASAYNKYMLQITYK